jgi:hypothetical protein
MELEAKLKTTAANSGRTFDEQVVQLATDLKGQLINASTFRATEQGNLTLMIQQQLQHVQKDEDLSKGTSTPAGVSSPQTGLVFELYGNANNPTTTFEERLLNLERLLGNPHQHDSSSSRTIVQPSSSLSTSANHKSLLNRLEEMEGLIATIDSTSLDKVTTKAKIIRTDLEAASKARNKLAATYKKEDSKMIQQLYQQMVDLEGLGSFLPSLVERLEQLNKLHRQSSIFGTRLKELERGVTQVGSSASQLEDGIATLQTAMAENIARMERNMQVLDQKLSSL